MSGIQSLLAISIIHMIQKLVVQTAAPIPNPLLPSTPPPFPSPASYLSTPPLSHSTTHYPYAPIFPTVSSSPKKPPLPYPETSLPYPRSISPFPRVFYKKNQKILPCILLRDIQPPFAFRLFGFLRLVEAWRVEVWTYSRYGGIGYLEAMLEVVGVV